MLKNDKIKFLLSLAQEFEGQLDFINSDADDIYIEPTQSMIPADLSLNSIEELDQIKEFNKNIKDLLKQYDHTAEVSNPLLDQSKNPAASSSSEIKSTKFQDRGYQAPIKSNFYSSGNFSVTPTDPRHTKGHMGVDLRAPGGTLIYPFLPGIVTNITPNSKGGYVVNIDHQDGFKTYYAHCGTIKTNVGDIVGYDDPIATVGDSGNAKGTWPHLHFQVSKNGVTEDPSKYFNVPKFTNPDKNEQMWLSPSAIQEASNFNINNNLANNKKVANSISRISNLANKYYNISKIR
jgi:murein DD-endopeptidase MepM/ murein hydrolase activator NlpD